MDAGWRKHFLSQVLILIEGSGHAIAPGWKI